MKSMAGSSARTGCWVHCYREEQKIPYFIVRKGYESGGVSLSYRILEVAEDAERLLVSFGVDPAEAHVRLQEAIEHGSAYVKLRETSSE